MKLRLVAFLAVLLALLGGGAALAVVTTGEVSACATATTPAHTISDNGSAVATIPGASSTRCVTSTYTTPTETVTSTASQTVTSTVTQTVTVQGGAPKSLELADFETGDLSQWDGRYCYQTYSCTVVDAPGRAGKAGRFEIRANETSPIGSAHAQTQINSDERAGTESWWHWDVYLPADFVDSNSFWQVLVEWHDFKEGSSTCQCPGSPPLTFQEIKGRYVVRIVNSADETQGNYWTEYDLGAAPRGAWTSFDMHAVWSSNPAAAVTDVYVNGALAQHVTGHPNMFAGYFNYFLAGWYRATSSTPQTIFLDNVCRTATGPVSSCP